jgi:hypothetical protein
VEARWVVYANDFALKGLGEQGEVGLEPSFPRGHEYQWRQVNWIHQYFVRTYPVAMPLM